MEEFGDPDLKLANVVSQCLRTLVKSLRERVCRSSHLFLSKLVNKLLLNSTRIKLLLVQECINIFAHAGLCDSVNLG